METIVGKAGGTSNADAPAITQSLELAEHCAIFAVSAPGKVNDGKGADDKVTDQLLGARQAAKDGDDVLGREIAANITARYDQIVTGLGVTGLGHSWLSDISMRVQIAAQSGVDAASMLGEQLMAEVYKALTGRIMLNPGLAPHDLEDDPSKWSGWLHSIITPGQRYILPGNITQANGHLATFDRGGSDISGALAAYATQADAYWNLTDGPARSVDPRIVQNAIFVPHLTYSEGRELGLNGTGLLHPAAMVPGMVGNFPTIIRSTFDRDAPVTIMDNDNERARRERAGKVVAFSLQSAIALDIHEPGMAEATGRLEEFDRILAQMGVPLIDSVGRGADRQRLLLSSTDEEAATDAAIFINAMVGLRKGAAEMSRLALVTLVGHNLGECALGILRSIHPDVLDDAEASSIEIGTHTIRFGTDPAQGTNLLTRLHAELIENQVA